MGKLKLPGKVKLITSVFAADKALVDKAARILEGEFGRIDFRSPLLKFSHTDYYRKEMGPGLKRVILSFAKLVRPELAYKTKIRTNAIEDRLRKKGKRTVNIDPGYVDLSKLVLFSTKDYTHRIPMAGGIFAETTLFYRDKRYNPWPWTYPDYASEEYAGIFEDIRRIYKGDRR